MKKNLYIGQLTEQGSVSQVITAKLHTPIHSSEHLSADNKLLVDALKNSADLIGELKNTQVIYFPEWQQFKIFIVTPCSPSRQLKA